MWTDRAVTYISVDFRGKTAYGMIGYEEKKKKKYDAVYIETMVSVYTDTQIVVIN